MRISLKQLRTLNTDICQILRVIYLDRNAAWLVDTNLWTASASPPSPQPRPQAPPPSSRGQTHPRPSLERPWNNLSEVVSGHFQRGLVGWRERGRVTQRLTPTRASPLGG